MLADEEWQIINDNEHSWQEDHTVPENVVVPERGEIEKRKTQT